MLSRSCFWFALAAVGALAAGCHAPRAKSAAIPPPKVAQSQTAVSNIQPRISDQELAEAHAHYSEGVIHDLENEPQLALDDFYQAALKDPSNETLILEVTRRLLQVKQPQKALELLTRAVAQPDASGLIFARLGFVYFQLGKNSLAIDASLTAIKKSPDSLSGHQNLFLIYLQNKQPQEALKILDDAAKVSNTNPEFLIGVGELYASFGIQTPGQKEAVKLKAIAIFQRAEKLNPANPQQWLRLADGFNAAGDAEKAAQIYRDLLKRFADMPFLEQDVREKLADIYLRGDDRKRAAEQLEAIIRDDPTDAQAYYFLGSIAYDSKNYTQAAEHFAKTVLLNPGFEPAYYGLARAQLNRSQNNEALAVLNQARQKFPAGFDLEYLTGIAYSRQKDWTNAMNHFTAAEFIAHATDPKRLGDELYFELANAQLSQNHYSEALATLDQAQQKFPKNFALEYLTGTAYARQKNWTNAIHHFTAAQAMAQAADTNGLSDVYFQLGAACERNGDYAQAEKYFQQCLELNPNFDEAQNYLGFMWADHGEKLPQARELIEKALKAKPENDAYLDSMGWVLFKLNQPKEALDYILKAIQFSKQEDAEVYNHLGDIYSVLGEMEKAREAWRKSASIEPNEQVQKKLDSAIPK